jgi:hypothetical protein
MHGFVGLEFPAQRDEIDALLLDLRLSFRDRTHAFNREIVL